MTEFLMLELNFLVGALRQVAPTIVRLTTGILMFLALILVLQWLAPKVIKDWGKEEDEYNLHSEL